MSITYINAISDLPYAGPSHTTGERGRGCRAGTSAPILLRHLAGMSAGEADGTLADALRRVWFSEFCTGAASVAPDWMRGCAECREPFVAGDWREIFCGARCRNTAVKRRYRARLRVRRGAPRAEA